MKAISKFFLAIFRFFYPKGGYKKAYNDGLAIGRSMGIKHVNQYNDLKAHKKNKKRRK